MTLAHGYHVIESLDALVDLVETGSRSTVSPTKEPKWNTESRCHLSWLPPATSSAVAAPRWRPARHWSVSWPATPARPGRMSSTRSSTEPTPKLPPKSAPSSGEAASPDHCTGHPRHVDIPHAAQELERLPPEARYGRVRRARAPTAAIASAMALMVFSGYQMGSYMLGNGPKAPTST